MTDFIETSDTVSMLMECGLNKAAAEAIIEAAVEMEKTKMRDGFDCE